MKRPYREMIEEGYRRRECLRGEYEDSTSLPSVEGGVATVDYVMWLENKVLEDKR